MGLSSNELIQHLERELPTDWNREAIRKVSVVQQMLAASPSIKFECIRYFQYYLKTWADIPDVDSDQEDPIGDRAMIFTFVIDILLTRDFECTSEELEQLVDHPSFPIAMDAFLYPWKELVALIQRVGTKSGLTEPTQAAIQKFVKTPLRQGVPKEFVTRLAKLQTLIDSLNPKLNQANNKWSRLVALCGTATSSQPSTKMLNAIAPLIAEIGPEKIVSFAGQWLDAVAANAENNSHWSLQTPDGQTHRFTGDTIRGLIFVITFCPSPELCRTLSRFCLACLKKIPGLGPRLPAVANACVYALGQLTDKPECADAALGQLARLQTSIKFRTTLKQLEKALEAAATRRGMSREDLEELGVPTYGFSSDGLLTESLGDCRVELRITGADVTTTWFNAKNKQVKAAPAEIKRDHAETLKEIKGAALDAAAMLTAQRARLDALMISTKSWPLADFRTRYLDHPITGSISRKLIWLIDGTPALFENSQPVDHDGKPITHGQTADITIWHPALRPTAEILAWRKRLETLQITQPFKQAHREIYLLTDAERNTRTYSNRFAAHIIKQHQFNALAAARGWKSKLRLNVDDEYTAPCKILPQFNLRAEFWVEGSGDQYGTDTNDTGVYLRLATDQVRFYPINAAQPSAHASGGGYGEPLAADPLPLDQIPALAFSEIMRDVDLFVGVCSIANDPNWTDGAHTAAQNNYWQSQSFGDLSATAQTRKTVLESLLPRLAIAPQCSLSDKFLVVKGTKRTYKIHLGSANILMEPNDQYLCIVPDSSARSASASASQNLYLPFEGDNVLSIILSKALLLASDHKITDPSILSQIART